MKYGKKISLYFESLWQVNKHWTNMRWVLLQKIVLETKVLIWPFQPAVNDKNFYLQPIMQCAFPFQRSTFARIIHCTHYQSWSQQRPIFNPKPNQKFWKDHQKNVFGKLFNTECEKNLMNAIKIIQCICLVQTKVKLSGWLRRRYSD